MAVFNPGIPPQEEPTGEVVFNQTEVKFGEGYSQGLGEGMNETVQTWPLTFVGTNTEILPIKTFFETHKGYLSFDWTPPGPGQVQGKYIVKRYQLIPAANNNCKLSVTLEQVYR